MQEVITSDEFEAWHRAVRDVMQYRRLPSLIDADILIDIIEKMALALGRGKFGGQTACDERNSIERAADLDRLFLEALCKQELGDDFRDHFKWVGGEDGYVAKKHD